jgi:hypothetical protein
VLSRIIQENDEFWSLSNHCQDHIRERWNGYAPPGTCTTVPLPSSMLTNPLKGSSIAILPTMRVPDVIDWHLDLVYNLTWSLFVEIERWNASIGSSGNKKIESVLLCGLGTGTGNISAVRCAQQMILAVKHFYFDEPLPDHPRWSHKIIGQHQQEIIKTIVDTEPQSERGTGR